MWEGFLEPAEEVLTRLEGGGCARVFDPWSHFLELVTILANLHFLEFERKDDETTVNFHAHVPSCWV